jgi:GxxExxY protein
MWHGFLESVYEQCMLIELHKLYLKVANQHPVNVFYENRMVGVFATDLFVSDSVLVELKAVRSLLPVHEVQLVNYLKASGIDVGLLINFGEQKVEVKRKLRRLPSSNDLC